jgi:hypothetical protein
MGHDAVLPAELRGNLMAPMIALCASTRQWILAQFAGHGSNDLAAKEACLRDCRGPERFHLDRTPAD